jgi:hypothetical protein
MGAGAEAGSGRRPSPSSGRSAVPALPHKHLQAHRADILPVVRICDKSGRSPQSERGARRLPLAIAFYVPALSGLPRVIAQTLRAPLQGLRGGRLSRVCSRSLARRLRFHPFRSEGWDRLGNEHRQ